ncbi:hypothetical protein DFH06DRAFT_1303059 [Mycena polygramma]|nr:hypothetical protein DFH06DRAFT_1303059 [Mycena polygramma]
MFSLPKLSPTAKLFLGETGFYMDGLQVGPPDINATSSQVSPTQAQYNVPVYTNTSIADGRHQFIINGGNNIIFDYAVYTSGEPDTSSSDPLLGSATLTSASQMQSSSGKKPPVAAIAGAVVGTIVAVFIACVGLILTMTFSHDHSSGMQQSGSPSTDALIVSKESRQSSSTDSPPELQRADDMVTPSESDDAGVAEQVRVMKAQLERLEQRVEGSGSAGSQTTSVGRPFSTMKREQTRVLQEHGLGTGVVDSLVHTEGGLRLTAERSARPGDELPPSYDAD